MPGFLLHKGASVTCTHGGQSMPTVSIPRVKVSGQEVVVQPPPYTVAACPFVTPGGTAQPCVTASWTTAAVRVKAMGQAVLLQDSQATCTPNGTPLLITATQVRVKGM